MKVHYCDYASQPDIRLACSQVYTTPAWKKTQVLPSSVYEAVNGELYTFDSAKVTCPQCRCSLLACFPH